MTSLIKMYVNNNRNIINIVVFSFISLILLLISWIVDINGIGQESKVLSALMLEKDISGAFLASLAGVFLTVTTFSFTTILTVLNKYSNEYTPRIVQDFIDKPFVLSLFGIFIGGFFYSVFSLLMIQNIEDGSKAVAGTMGLLYAMASMIYFILFVRTVLKSVNTSDVIEYLFNRAMNIIGKEEEKDGEFYAEQPQEIKGEGLSLFANKSGYIYSIDEQKLLNLLENEGQRIVISTNIGDYALEGKTIAEVYGVDEKSMEEIGKAFIYSDSLNDKEDYRHEVRNLVEIALKAISPGINDPNTAILCIHKISLILSTIYATRENYLLRQKDGQSKIVYELQKVEDELYYAFYQLIHYGKSDPSVCMALLKGLRFVYVNAKSTHKNKIEKYYKDVYELCVNSMQSNMDKEKLLMLENII